jgi:hypothetical protein
VCSDDPMQSRIVLPGERQLDSDSTALVIQRIQDRGRVKQSVIPETPQGPTAVNAARKVARDSVRVLTPLAKRQFNISAASREIEQRERSRVLLCRHNLSRVRIKPRTNSPNGVFTSVG